jgi:hypothetical protein
MEENDYDILLAYLMNQISEFQPDIVQEINNQIIQGKTLTVQDNSGELRRLNIKESDVGKTQTLPLTSKEAFAMAIEYLSRVVVDVPAYGQKIKETFGNRVEWAFDRNPVEKTTIAPSGYALDEFLYPTQDIEDATRLIQRIKDLIR